jgi:hypothetical protein
MNDLNNEVPKFVTQARASYLLGIPQEDLRRISETSGLGRVECAGNEEEIYFTYEEIGRICQLASQRWQPFFRPPHRPSPQSMIAAKLNAK